MGIKTRLGSWLLKAGSSLSRRSLENPSTSLSDPDEWLWDAWGAESAESGSRVGRKQALGYSPYWRGTVLIASYIAKIPVHVYRKTGNGRERDTTHAASRLVGRQPNPWMKAYDFKATLQHHALDVGNGYARIVRRGSNPVELWPLDPTETFPVIVRNNVSGERELWYSTKIDGSDARFPHEDVLHIRGLGFDGLVGYPARNIAKNTIGIGIAARQYGSYFFKNNAVPAVTIEFPGTVKEEAAAAFESWWLKKLGGTENAHKPMVLRNGAKANVISRSAKESQLTELRLHEVREAANILGLPPHKLGDPTRTAYASLEQENQALLDDCLDPWMVQWETELTQKLMSTREIEDELAYCEFNRPALIRADISARYKAYQIGIQSGFLSRDEVRQRENINDITDGNGKGYFVPLNVTVVGGPNPIPDDGDTPDDEPEPQAEPQQAEPNDERKRALLSVTVGTLVKRIVNSAARASSSPEKLIKYLAELGERNSDTAAEILTAFDAGISLEDFLLLMARSIHEAIDPKSGDPVREQILRAEGAIVTKAVEACMREAVHGTAIQ